MKKTVLITGASSGFGLEFAKIFAKEGYNLVITAKPKPDLSKVKSELEKNYGIKVLYKFYDLSVPGNPQKLFNWTKKEKLTISILVNNAGIGLYGEFISHKLAEEQELINLNVVALTELCHLFISDMVKHGSGKVLNIASIAGLQAGPYYATYFASKAYVLLLTEALQQEFAPKNIQISALCPGVANTGFFKRAGMREDSRMLKIYLMDPKKVAQTGYDGLMTGKRVIIPGARNKFAALGYRVFPRSVITKITKRLIQKAAK